MAFIDDIDTAVPAGGDLVSAGDNDIRSFKADVKASFPNIDGAVTHTAAELNDAALKSTAGTVSAIWKHSATLRLSNDIAVQGRDVGDTSWLNLIKLSSGDQVQMGGVSGETLINAATTITLNKVAQAVPGTAALPGIRGAAADDGIRIDASETGFSRAGVSAMTIGDSLNNSVNPFTIQGAEMFALRVEKLTNSTLAVRNRTANSSGWTVDIPSSGNPAAIRFLHSFGSTDYVAICVGSRTDVPQSVDESTRTTNEFRTATNVLNGGFINVYVLRIA